MDILRFFSYNKEKPFHIYRLNDFDVESLLGSITKDFRQCYITNEDLIKLAKKNGISKKQLLESYILPDKGNIKSGDFGEMISYFFIEEHYADKGYLLFCPRKWLWKDDRNKASPYSDAVGFYRDDEMNPSKNDFIVCVESKMKATKSKKHRIQEAVDGANIDRLTRLGKTLGWLKEKYVKDCNKEKSEYIKRYTDPVGNGTYKKIFKAFTILDKEFEKYEFSLPIKDNDGIAIIVIAIKNLKDVYEANLKRIIESV